MLFNMVSVAQTKTNIEIINSLIDSSITDISKDFVFEDVVYYLQFNGAPEHSILKNQALYSLSKKVNVTDNKTKSIKSLFYTVKNISTIYLDPYKDGLFGSYKMERQISLLGNFLIYENDAVVKGDEFLKTYRDTIDYDRVKEYESISFSFTHGRIPDEPFFASLLEPAIAVASIAATVILFFTVRSN
ncbi:MAG: hypothetical protein CVV23_01420 [Ignavibacteriae bacterium HGW-Ignavibacteriae-2]|nr:MAG: hypothetical protein CVV23_01420 [Ignavibacteriae bacterium HGW-Ignavibacteriae-2]